MAALVEEAKLMHDVRKQDASSLIPVHNAETTNASLIYRLDALVSGELLETLPQTVTMMGIMELEANEIPNFLVTHVPPAWREWMQMVLQNLCGCSSVEKRERSHYMCFVLLGAVYLCVCPSFLSIFLYILLFIIVSIHRTRSPRNMARQLPKGWGPKCLAAIGTECFCPN